MNATKPTPVRGNAFTAQIEHIQIPPDKADRGAIDPRAIAELATSLAAVGMLQPVVVTRTNIPGADRQFILVAGERRIRAAMSLGWTEVPAMLMPVSAPDSPDIEIMRAAENLQRVDLNAVEAAVVVGDMLEDQIERELQAVGYAKGIADIPAPALAAARIAAVKALAGRLGKPEQYIRDHAFMAELDSKTRKLLVDGRLPVPHARELAKVLDPDKRYDIALRAAADPRGGRGREYAWPIADLRREVAKVYCSLGQVPWKLDAPFAGKPACSECPENSANKPGLFEGAAPVHGWSAFKEPAAGICLSRACFGAKSAAVTRAAARVARLTISAAKGRKGDPEPAPMAPPEFVQPAKFKTAIAEKVDAAKTARKDGAGKSSVPKAIDAAQAADRKALDRYEAVFTKWREKSIKPIKKALEAKPWLVPFLEPIANTCPDYAKPPPGVLALIERMAAIDGTSADMVLLSECEKLDRYAGPDCLSWHALGRAGLLPAVAAMLKVPIPPAPEKPAAATKGKGRKGGAK